MSLPIELVLEALRAHGYESRLTPSGWTCRCPAHDDRRPSLSINQGDDGRALVHCHAGCAPEAIVAAIGLTLRDLMPADTVDADGNAKTRRKTAIVSTSARKAYPSAGDAVAELERRHGPRSGMWTYLDAQGEPVGVVGRWDGPDGKTFRPVSRNGTGWIIGGMPEPRPLYGLPDLLAARPDQRVYVCEGEKAAEAARSIGLLATTSPHGGKSAAKADWTPLAGHHVVVPPDHDNPGGKYAADVARLAMNAGARSVRIVRLVELWPDLPEHGDIFDFIAARRAAGRSDAEIRAEIERLAKEAQPVVPPPTDLFIRGNVVRDGLSPVLVCMADVEPREVNWLWPGRVPLGRITLLVGRPGEGKSFLTTDMAARVTTGRAWPDGAVCPVGSVIFITAEDHPGNTIRPRLDAHGADVRKVHLFSMVRRVNESGKSYDVMFTLTDLEALEEALQHVPDCKLIVIDPIGSFLGGRTDAHRDNEVRGVLAPVAKLAEEYGPAVLVVAHTRKSGADFADDTALGSRAFTGIARAVWHLRRDKDNKARRLLLPGKNNLAPEGNGLAFAIVGDPPAVAWEHDPVAMSADEALALERSGDGARTERDDAKGWLSEFLADGPRPALEVQEEARNAGFTDATVKRAKAELGIESRKSTFDGRWAWVLPGVPEDAQATKALTEDAHNLESEHLGEKQAKNNGNCPKVLTSEGVSILGEHLGSVERLGQIDRANGWGEEGEL